MAIIYISYRPEDCGMLAESLGLRLAQLGSHTIYPAKAPPGTDALAARWAQLRQAQCVIVVIGPRWLTFTDYLGQRSIDDPTDVVHQEILGALRMDKPLIPVLLAYGQMPAARDLPPPLRPLAGYQPYQPQPSPDSSREAFGLHMKIVKTFALDA